MKSPSLWLLAALGVILVAGLSFGRSSAPSRGMDTTSRRQKLSPAEKRARRAEQARRRRAEDKADYELAAKRCAEIDAGQVKVLSREEFLRR